MLIALIFSLFGILAWVAVGVLLYFRRKATRKIEMMRRVDTSSAAAVSSMTAGDPVEVKGTLRCQDPLTSEMAEQRCA